jgi:outer membrane protein W
MRLKSAIALLFLCAALPLAAQGRNIHVTVFYSQAEMQGENDFGDGFETEFDDGRGYGASANLSIGRFFSVEAAAFSLRADSQLVFEDAAAFDLGSLNLTPISLGGQFHVLGSSRFDPYVGGGIAYVLGDDFFTSDLEFAGVGRIELENEFTYYINAGIAFQISEGFGIVIDGRQIQYEPNTRSAATGVEQELEITPRILSAGLRLRF